MNSLQGTLFLVLSCAALSAFNSVANAQTCGSGGGATVCLTATGSSSNIQLNWTVTGTITAIEVYRDINSDPSGRTRLTSLAATARSYTDSTAVTGTPYWYWIKFRANGTFYNSNAAAATRGGGTCNPTAITPVINGSQTASVTISSGAQVSFAPLPSSGGSWSWSGCGTSGTSRTQAVSPAASCSATATFTNSCGARTTQVHSITVSGGGGGGGSGTPVGFGRSTTGGAGGITVTARTGTEINAALCGRAAVSTPIIIRVDGTINHGNTTDVSGACDATATEIQFKGVSNVSLIGVGNRGVLDQIGVHLRNTSNIVIQNLWIRNVKKSGSPISNGGDAIGMESGVNNVWVDHNTLEASGGESSGYDSLLDMKAGVTNITVSWNHYRNSSRAGLIGSSDDDAANTNITFHHNWYENIEQRTPLLRHGLAHSYNNYFFNLSNSDMIHGINSRMGGRILVDGNYFKNSNNPLLASDDSDEPGCWQTRSNTLDSISYDRSVGDGALVVPIISGGQFDSTCTVTVPYSYTLDSSANIPNIVMGGAGVGKTGQ
jgi:pectate lyase